MRAQCVLLATTLLHSGAKFHYFLYTGSKTVRVYFIKDGEFPEQLREQ